MADVFVSYAAEDRDRIVPLVERFMDLGWSVWWDRDLVAGPNFEQEIERAIDNARCVVVAWSKHSIHSRWCRAEASEGLDRGVLVPLRLDDVRPPLSFRGSHTATLLGWPKQPGDVALVVAGIRQCLDGAGAAHEAALGRPPAVRPRRRVFRAVAAAVVLATAGIAAYLVSINAGNPFARAESMAVLPFANHDSDPALTALGLGLAEDVLAHLAGWSTPAVASRTSAFRLAADGADVAAIADALQVHYLLEGSLRRVGGEVRITAQLIRAEDGYRVWSDAYDRAAEDLGDAAATVAGRIAHTSRLWLLRDVEKALHRSFAPNLEALEVMNVGYDQYILLANGHGGSWPLITDYYRRAVELDPDFWYAAQLLGNAYFRRAGRDVPVAEAGRRSAQALELCDRGARTTPHIAIGPVTCELQRAQRLFFVDLNYAAAQDLAQRVLREQPGAFSTHWLLAMTYLAEGRPAPARASLAIADQVDHRADQLGFLMFATLASRWLGDLRGSRDYAERALDIVDNARLRAVLLRGLSLVEVELGDRQTAARYAEQAWRLTGDVEPRQFTEVFQRLGDVDRAASAYRQGSPPPTSLQQQHYADWWSEGEVKAQVAMGEYAAAADSFERYVAQRNAAVVMMIRSDRALAPYRSQPWFAEVLAALESVEAVAP